MLARSPPLGFAPHLNAHFTRHGPHLVQSVEVLVQGRQGVEGASVPSGYALALARMLPTLRDLFALAPLDPFPSPLAPLIAPPITPPIAPPITPPESLESVLERVQLGEYLSGLRRVGCHEVEDLGRVDDARFREAGLNDRQISHIRTFLDSR